MHTAHAWFLLLVLLGCQPYFVRDNLPVAEANLPQPAPAPQCVVLEIRGEMPPASPIPRTVPTSSGVAPVPHFIKDFPILANTTPEHSPSVKALPLVKVEPTDAKTSSSTLPSMPAPTPIAPPGQDVSEPPTMPPQPWQHVLTNPDWSRWALVPEHGDARGYGVQPESLPETLPANPSYEGIRALFLTPESHLPPWLWLTPD